VARTKVAHCAGSAGSLGNQIAWRLASDAMKSSACVVVVGQRRSHNVQFIVWKSFYTDLTSKYIGPYFHVASICGMRWFVETLSAIACVCSRTCILTFLVFWVFPAVT
jgi:hypothetical protein